MAVRNNTFQPSMADLTLYAFQLIGLRPSSLLQEHIESARMATNMVLSSWSAQGVNLWEVELTTVPLEADRAIYDVDPDTVMVLDAYVSVYSGDTKTDRVISPVSRSEFASYPNKRQTGFPTVYWFERTLDPTLHIWPVPAGENQGDGGSMSFYRMKQIATSGVNGAPMPQIPLYFVEAFALALASRLAAIWSPERAAALMAAADASYTQAALQNVEDAGYYISPMIAGYYR